MSDPRTFQNRVGLIGGLVAGVVVIVLVIVGLMVWAPWSGTTPAPTKSPKPSASVTPTSTASASKTPTATPTPTPAAAAAELVISATGLTMKDANGAVMWDYSYTENPDTVVAAIQSAIGVMPAVTDLTGQAQTTHKALYEWSGFKLYSNRDGWDAPNSLLRAFSVWTSAPKLGSVTVTTPESISVGTPAADLAPYAGPSSVSNCYLLEKDGASGIDDPTQGGMFTGRFLNACVDPAAGVVVYVMAPHTLLVDF